MLFFFWLYCAHSPAVTKFVRGGSEAAKAPIFETVDAALAAAPGQPARLNVNDEGSRQNKRSCLN